MRRYGPFEYPYGLEFLHPNYRPEPRGSVTLDDPMPPYVRPATQRAADKRYLADLDRECAADHRRLAALGTDRAAYYWALARHYAAMAETKEREREELLSQAAVELEHECIAALSKPAPPPPPSLRERLEAHLRQTRWMAELADATSLPSAAPSYHLAEAARLEARIAGIFEWTEEPPA